MTYATLASGIYQSSPRGVGGVLQVPGPSQWWKQPSTQFYPAVFDPDQGAGSFFRIKVDNELWGEIEDYRNFGGIDGVSHDDNSSTFGRVPNVDSGLWAYSDLPLTFDPITLKVCQFTAFSTSEYQKWLADTLHGTNLAHNLALPATLGGNVDECGLRFHAKYFDWIGGEVPQGAVPDADAWLRRFYGYRKVVAPLTVPGGVTSSNTITAYLKNGIEFGYYPGLNGSYWDDSTKYERDRPYFQHLMPVIQKLARAGWEPVPYATPSTGFHRIERFGQAGDPEIFLTVKNVTGFSNSPTITLQGVPLGIASGETVTCTNLITGAAQTVTRSGADAQISITISDGDVHAYKFTIN